MGTPPPQDEPKYRSSTRTIYQIKVELPEYAYKDWSKYKTVDKELWGNRGYIYGGAQIKKMSEPAKIQVEKKEVTPILLPQETVEPKRVEPEPTPVVRLPQEPTKPQKNSFTTYVVQKNDTLGKVSKKVYGTAAKWQMIYEANKDVLKNPNKIYPGQKLRIPR
ncbi:MAG: LysM peptidoglycan-binding domain-containing protein [PVC group bacterium]|nr:LysM peptidoglycan-binding domain-containing protein [PVC group bacterium]